jgi:anti-sigma factor RsiW
MSEHLTEWLGAFVDGELHGAHLRRVQTHLEHCESCREEVRALRELAAVLDETRGPALRVPERFVSQVNLRLARRPRGPATSRALEVGWWMIPVGLLTLWVFISTAVAVRGVFSSAAELGLLPGAPAWLAPDPGAADLWSGTLAQFGLLGGQSLQWARETESFTRTILPRLIWQVSIALLYLSWIAIWWARQARQGHGRPLEG